MPSNSLSTGNANGWFQNLTRQLGISSKISCGYGMAMGIAILGTLAGIAAGGYYQSRAMVLEAEAWQEIALLARLQTNLLQTQNHQQQLLIGVQSSQEFEGNASLLSKYATDFEADWAEYVTSHANDLENPDLGETETEVEIVNRWLDQNADLLTQHFQKVNQLLQQIDERTLTPANIATIQQQLLALHSSLAARQIHEFSDSLQQLTQVSYEEYAQAKTAAATARVLRRQIIVGSILVSVAIATLLAISTSRAIARPIRSLTHIAQQVTQDSNFELQAPIISTDETGQLATAFNHLIQRVKQLLEEQKNTTQQQLLQNEKMASLGRMLAGVAHEINNPVNFIYGNLPHASDYIQNCFDLLHAYQEETPNPSDTIQTKTADIELDFLEEDLPKLLQSMQLGAERARQLVLSLKNFSRLEDKNPHPVDLHACLDSSLLILNNRLKQRIDVTCQYGEIPTIKGYTGSLYQVFTNLLSNAIDALEEQPNADTRKIAIATECLDREQVVIKIADNGPGISPENQTRIFDTFFTTKPVDVGTGLGLAISREIVEEKHNGQLRFRSTLGSGTEFSIILPIQPRSDRTPDLNLPVTISTSA